MDLRTSLILLVTAAAATAAPARRSPCITSCEGRLNGNYLSCLGSGFFASCSNGYLVDGRPCPPGLVWDDRLKACNYGAGSTFPAGTCVESCELLINGDYQSCLGCNVYVTCYNGIIYDKRRCVPGLVWDDRKKQCDYTSTTCKVQNATAAALSSGEASLLISSFKCVSSCLGMRDGNYHSCQACNVFATCTNERLIDGRRCPARLVWNDNVKMCTWGSSTCPLKTALQGATQGGACVGSCAGVPDGDYQSCHGCNVYASCSNNRLIDGRPCPAGLVWDDATKKCLRTSTTCEVLETTPPALPRVTTVVDDTTTGRGGRGEEPSESNSTSLSL